MTDMNDTLKDDRLWNLAVRKPLRWFLRRFLPPIETEELLRQIEEAIQIAKS